VLSRRINVLDVVFDGLQLAGFQVSITGRFWVSTEGIDASGFAPCCPFTGLCEIVGLNGPTTRNCVRTNYERIYPTGNSLAI
jgi:hypothetical protein